MNLKLLRSLTVLFFLFPYLYIFYSLDFKNITWNEDFSWALKNSFEQSFFSALASLALGIVLSLGLVKVQSKFRNLIELFFLSTSFVPSLFLVLALMKLIDPFPMGLWGVVLVHVSSFFGFVGVLFARSVESKVGSLAETAFVLGASKFYFLQKILLPQLKFEALFLGLIVFQMCMTSFSVPMLVGGHQGTNLEVLMYEKIRLNADWNVAAQIGLLQVILVTFVSILIFGFKQKKFESSQKAHLIGIYWPLYLGFLIQGLLILGYLLNLQNIEISLQFIKNNYISILELAFVSLLMSLIAFILFKIVFYILAKVYYSKPYAFFLKNYIQPSVVLSSMSFILIGSNQGLFIYFKVILIFVILNSIGLFKVGLQSLIEDLDAQRTVAMTLGASDSFIFKKILYPQLHTQLNRYALLGSVLIIGDFSIGRILALKDLTLSMFMQTLMSGYRLEIATWISLILLVVSFVSYILAKELGHVCYKKFGL